MSLRGPEVTAFALYADLLQQPSRVDGQHDHADTSRHGRRMDHDDIGGGGDIVATGGAHIHNRRNNRNIPRVFKAFQFVIDDVGRCDCAAWAIDAEDDRLDALVLGSLAESSLMVAIRLG